MHYSICNNYNIEEKSTEDRREARKIAHVIADRDNMPAFVDASEDGLRNERMSFRVNPA